VASAPVRYLDAEPNGLAAMLGGLIQANLHAHPELESLLARRAVFVIRAPDVDVAVSIKVGEGRVVVRNGVVARRDVLVEGDSSDLVAMSSVPLRFGLPDVFTPGGREVIRKLLTRRLTVKGLIRHPAKLARLNALLSVG
jgi:hypothetical protein